MGADDSAAISRHSASDILDASSFDASWAGCEQHGGVEAAVHYDSLDFEPTDASVQRKLERTMVEQMACAASKWTLCLLIGLCTALTALLVNVGVENIAAVKIGYTLLLKEESVASAWFFYCTFDLMLVGLSVLICTFVAPAAAGSGIPEVKAYLNGIDIPEVLSVKTLVAKVTAVTGSVASGLALGKEGPFVHIGASIAAVLSKLMSRAMYTLHGIEIFTADWEGQDFVTCGASAGVAAAFHAPVGGVLFGLEELMSWWRTSVMWHAFFTTAVVTVAVRMGMKMCANGRCGMFGKNSGMLVFNMTDGQDDFEYYELLPMMLLGVVGGLLGSAFNALIDALARWRETVLHRGKHRHASRLAEALVISLMTSTLSFGLPFMVHCSVCPALPITESCPTAAPHMGNFVPFECSSPHSYNEMATLIFTTQDDAIRNLFSANTKREFSVPTLLSYFVVIFFLAVITYGIQLPSGLFVPCILCGATYGRLVGMLMTNAYPDSHMDEGTYALLGAASFLGGAMRSTVSLCVMLLELTGHLHLLPLIMLVLLLAKAVGDSTGVIAIYELLIYSKRYPFLASQPRRPLVGLTAQAVCSQPAAQLRACERVGSLVQLLEANRHSGFPVLKPDSGAGGQGAGAVEGIILRSQLLAVLADRRCFQSTPELLETPPRAHSAFKPAGGGRARQTTALPRLSEAELEMWVDLRPHTSPATYVVPADASLHKVYTLFRSLGLRHLLVVPPALPCRGIITRKDLVPHALDALHVRRPLREGDAGTPSDGAGDEQEAFEWVSDDVALLASSSTTISHTHLRRNGPARERLHQAV